MRGRKEGRKEGREEGMHAHTQASKPKKAKMYFQISPRTNWTAVLPSRTAPLHPTLHLDAGGIHSFILA